MDEVLYERKGAGAWRCLNRPEEASPRGRGPTPPCGAGRVVCLIDPVGDVYACPFAIHDRFLAGNVLSGRGFDNVWKNARLFRELREPQSAGGCASCGHYDSCRGGCMAAKFFTGHCDVVELASTGRIRE